VRRNNKAEGLEETGTDQGAIRGGGVLQLAEQHQEGDVSEAEFQMFRFLVAFTKELVRNNPSGDVITLSLYAAAAEANIDEAQAKSFVHWVLQEQKNSHWPQGFF
jgi:hypothetical protein